MALHKSVVAYRKEQATLLQQGRKRCTKCKEVKRLTFFSKNNRIHGGYSNQCTACLSQGWQARTGRSVVTTHAAKAEQRELANEGKRRCASCQVVKSLDLDFKHRQDKWARFKDCCAECAREKNLQAKSAKAGQGERYRLANRVKRWARRCIESHTQRGFVVKATIEDLIKLVDGEGHGKCGYTGEEVLVGCGASIDMMDPHGEFAVGNLRLCSHACNSTKSAMTASEFEDYLAKNPTIVDRIRKNNRDRLKLYYVRNIPLDAVKDWATQWSTRQT